MSRRPANDVIDLLFLFSWLQLKVLRFVRCQVSSRLGQYTTRLVSVVVFSHILNFSFLLPRLLLMFA